MITIGEQNTLVDKAKTKKDGVYSYKGIIYKVVDGKLRYIARHGEILQCSGFFNVVVGSYNGYTDDAKKALKNIR